MEVIHTSTNPQSAGSLGAIKKSLVAEMDRMELDSLSHESESPNLSQNLANLVIKSPTNKIIRFSLRKKNSTQKDSNHKQVEDKVVSSLSI